MFDDPSAMLIISPVLIYVNFGFQRLYFRAQAEKYEFSDIDTTEKRRIARCKDYLH
jgi:hypothetical protein